MLCWYHWTCLSALVRTVLSANKFVAGVVTSSIVAVALVTGARRQSRAQSREREGEEGREGEGEWNGGSAAARGELVPTAHNPACRHSPEVRQRGREVGERGGRDFLFIYFVWGPHVSV